MTLVSAQTWTLDLKSSALTIRPPVIVLNNQLSKDCLLSAIQHSALQKCKSHVVAFAQCHPLEMLEMLEMLAMLRQEVTEGSQD